MKILIVRMYPDVLNIDSYNCQEIGLAKALIRQGNQCDIVLYTNKKESYENDVFFDDNKKIHIYYLRAKIFFKNAIFEKKLYKIAGQYDVVQTAEYDQISNVKLKKHCKQMVIYHGPYESNFTLGYKIKCVLSDIFFLFHKDYKKTYCLSKSSLATRFLNKKGFKNVTTVGVGIDTERFKSLDGPKNEIIEELKSEKKDLILYVGKIEKRRNIDFLVDRISEIKSVNENIKCVMVGSGNSKYTSYIKKYIYNKGLNSSIIIIDRLNQNELSELYKMSRVFLLPTSYEIFGMVLLEAMYFSTPVITTLNGGSSTLIKHRENGYIIDLKNNKEWDSTIEFILNHKQNFNTKEYILDNYTWDNLSKEFIKVYKSVVKSEKKH